MTTKFDIGDIVEVKNTSINIRYEVTAIMTISSATETIRYEIKDTYGRYYTVSEDKLVKAVMTKEEARNKAYEYIDSYFVEHDSDDYRISIRQEQSYFNGWNYSVNVINLNGEVFYFSKGDK